MAKNANIWYKLVIIVMAALLAFFIFYGREVRGGIPDGNQDNFENIVVFQSWADALKKGYHVG